MEAEKTFKVSSELHNPDAAKRIDPLQRIAEALERIEEKLEAIEKKLPNFPDDEEITRLYAGDEEIIQRKPCVIINDPKDDVAPEHDNLKPLAERIAEEMKGYYPHPYATPI